MNGIALNFLRLTDLQFSIRLYRFPFIEDQRPEYGDERAVRRSMDIDGCSQSFWTLFQNADGGVEVVLQAFDNIYATVDALRMGLIDSCRYHLKSEDFRVIDGVRRHVEIVVGRFGEGLQVMSLEPYFLRSINSFGFLADFRFHPEEAHRGTRRALELSLALSTNGQRNVNYYADRYANLAAFVKDYIPTIFPLALPGGIEVSVEPHLTQLKQTRLEVKRYIVGSNREAKSQFMGVKSSGPLKRGPADVLLYFLYRAEDRRLSHALFRALRGDSFATFLGMERMFGVKLSRENVRGATLKGFGPEEVERARDDVVRAASGRTVVPVVLTPFGRFDEPKENAPYWSLKHAFLSQRLPIQVVSTETVSNREKLKWSAAGIGLQVFAKAGGTPWRIRPKTEHCLVVGIGQAHRVRKKKIERYFAYSVVSDSSGIFEEVRVLAESGSEDSYLENFTRNLHAIIDEYETRFRNVVVHTTFSVRRRELESIANVLEQRRRTKRGEFVALKFNDRNRFFGFASEHNSRVPYESTVVKLSGSEYLVWFEGLQYGRPVVREMVAAPLHIRFIFPQGELTHGQQQAYLQDAINLSGANWRGFNAKSLPVSVYYAQLIARYLKEFEEHRLPNVDVNILTPWFL